MVFVENTGRGKLNLRYGVSLVPGVNEVDSEAWEKCKGETMTRHFLGLRQIKVVPGSVGSPTSQPAMTTTTLAEPGTLAEPESDPLDPPPEELEYMPPNYHDMKAADAKAMVQESEDIPLLREMLACEYRSTVVAGIKKRLQQLKGQG